MSIKNGNLRIAILQAHPIVLTFELPLANHLCPYQIRALDPIG